MAERAYQILTPTTMIQDGGWDMDRAAPTAYRGYLAAHVTGGSMGISQGSPYGAFYDFQHLVEHPQTDELGTNLAAKKVAVARGTFIAVVGKDLFKAGSVPAVNSKLYDGGTGTYATAGGTAIGYVLAHDTKQQVGGAVTLARCVFDFTAIL